MYTKAAAEDPYAPSGGPHSDFLRVEAERLPTGKLSVRAKRKALNGWQRMTVRPRVVSEEDIQDHADEWEEEARRKYYADLAARERRRIRLETRKDPAYAEKCIQQHEEYVQKHGEPPTHRDLLSK